MKSIRILVIVLCCALIFSFNLYAVDETFDYPVTLNRYNNLTNFKPYYLSPTGSHNLTSTNCKAFGPRVSFQHNKDTSYVVVVTINYSAALVSNIFSDTLIMAHLNSGEPTGIATPGNIYNKSSYQLVRKDNQALMILTYNTANLEYADTFNELYFACQSNIGSSTLVFDSVGATAYAVYDPPGTTLEDIEIQINNLITQNQTNSENLQQKIDDLIQSQNGNSSDIKDALEDIKDNQVIEQNYWQTVLTYGNTYNQIDQTIINGLGTAEDQLSNAEDAIQNKSKSLVNKVASQWTANKGVASSFLTTITPATTAVGTVIDNFFDAIPEEIKNAVITIMLIVFIGWLIGRVEG